MRWINRQSGVTPCLAGFFFLTAGFDAVAASSADSAEIFGLFKGTPLTANVIGVDSAQGLLCRVATDSPATNLPVSLIDRIRFIHADPETTLATCHVVLASGDELEGSLLAMDDKTLRLDTWYAGSLEIPRRSVERLDFMPAAYTVVYKGPNDQLDWSPLAGSPGLVAGGFQLIIGGLNPNPALAGGVGNVLTAVAIDAAAPGNGQNLTTNVVNDRRNAGKAVQFRSVSGNANIVVADAQPVQGNAQIPIVGGLFVAVNGPQNQGVGVFRAVGAAAGWTFRDGALASDRNGLIGRDCELDGCSCIFEFDLGYSGPFDLLLNLYCPSTDRSDYVYRQNTGWTWTVPANSAAASDKQLTLELANDRVTLLQAGAAYADQPQGVNFNQLALGGLSQKSGPVHVSLDCNRTDGTLTLRINGVPAQKWAGLVGFEDMGNGIVIGNAGTGEAVKVSNIQLRRRADGYDLSSRSSDVLDYVSFANHDSIRARVGGLAGGKLNLVSDAGEIHVPLERVRHVTLSGGGNVGEPAGPWTVRAVFSRGSSVTFRLEKWDDQAVSGHSATLGAVSFPRHAVRELQFHPAAHSN